MIAEKGTVLSLSYYQRAFEHIGRDKLFLIFSDDIEWCKVKILKSRLSIQYVIYNDDRADF